MPLPEQNFIIGGDPLSLDRIRAILTRLEDTIIFSLIERAQFAHNPKAYRRGQIQELKDVGFNGSWLEWFLKETETFHGACIAPLLSPRLPLSQPNPALHPQDPRELTCTSRFRTAGVILFCCSKGTQVHKVRRTAF